VETDGFAVEVNAYGGFVSGIAGRPDSDIGAGEFVRLVLLVRRPIGRHQHLHDSHEIVELVFGSGRRLFRPVANVLRGA